MTLRITEVVQKQPEKDVQPPRKIRTLGKKIIFEANTKRQFGLGTKFRMEDFSQGRQSFDTEAKGLGHALYIYKKKSFCFSPFY